MQFGYDDTVFHHRRDIVLAATFKLARGRPDVLHRILQENLSWRGGKHPWLDWHPSAGSIFKKIEGVGAGRLVDQCGLKGFRMGDAQISHIHANIMVNLGHATAKRRSRADHDRAADGREKITACISSRRSALSASSDRRDESGDSAGTQNAVPNPATNFKRAARSIGRGDSDVNHVGEECQTDACRSDRADPSAPPLAGQAKLNRAAAAIAPGDDSSDQPPWTLAAIPGLTPGIRKFRHTRRGRCQILSR